MSDWGPAHRIELAMRIASTLRDESSGIIMSRRVHELSELIVFSLTMPASFLNFNAEKFKEFNA